MALVSVSNMFSNGYRKAPQDEDGGEHLEYNQSRPQPTASNEELPSTRCPGPFFFVSSVLVLVLMLTLALITWNGDLTPYESLERRSKSCWIKLIHVDLQTP